MDYKLVVNSVLNTNREMISFMKFLRQLTKFMIKSYGKDLIGARAEMAKFVGGSIKKGEQTISSLDRFIADTQEVKAKIEQISRLLNSRITTLKSNYGLDGLYNPGLPLELDLMYKHVIDQAVVLRKETIDHLKHIAIKIHELEGVLGSELEKAKYLKQPHVINEIFRDANELEKILLNVEIPLHKKIVEEIPFRNKRIDASINIIKLNTGQTIMKMNKSLSKSVNDFREIENIKRKVLIGVLATLSLCFILINFDKFALSFMGSFGAKKIINRLKNRKLNGQLDVAFKTISTSFGGMGSTIPDMINALV